MAQMNIGVEWIKVAVAVTGLLIACALDLKVKRIPNALTFTMAFMGFLLCFSDQGISGLGQSFLGLFCGLMLLYIPFSMGGVGAGDVKLLAALGTFFGPLMIIKIFLASAIFGGMFSLAAMWKAKTMRNTFYGAFNRAFSLMTRSVVTEQPIAQQHAAGIPYAVAIACGALFVLFVLKGG
jgi:prepilin peptidase CpaA